MMYNCLFVLTQVQQQQQSAQADTMKSSVNGYHESLIEALRNAAATTSSQRGSNSSNSFGLGAGGGANTGGAGSNHRSSAASLTVNFNYKCHLLKSSKSQRASKASLGFTFHFV